MLKSFFTFLKLSRIYCSFNLNQLLHRFIRLCPHQGAVSVNECRYSTYTKFPGSFPVRVHLIPEEQHGNREHEAAHVQPYG